jgi:hypothetical protein
MADPPEGSRCPETADDPRIMSAYKRTKTTADTKEIATTALNSLEPVEKDIRTGHWHNGAQDQERVDQTHGRNLVTSPEASQGGWQSLPFEGQIEKVFSRELGDDSEGMSALDSPDSLILVEGEKPEGMLDDSPSRLEWLRQKRDESERNEHMDRVMAMIGHERVKEHFLAVKERVALARKWNEDPRSLNLNFVLHEGQAIGWFTQRSSTY